MSKVIKLQTTTQFFSEEKLPLEEEVAKIKKEHGDKVIKESITKNTRKGIEFYILECTVQDDCKRRITDEIHEIYKGLEQ